MFLKEHSTKKNTKYLFELYNATLIFSICNFSMSLDKLQKVANIVDRVKSKIATSSMKKIDQICLGILSTYPSVKNYFIVEIKNIYCVLMLS